MISAHKVGKNRLLQLRYCKAKLVNKKNKKYKELAFKKTKRSEWTGPFSDFDTKNWTDELKAKLHHDTSEDDGLFFMRVEDFSTYFNTLNACHYHEGNTLSSLPTINSSKLIACFDFKISKKGNYYFGVSQEDIRTFELGHRYGILSVVIAKITKNKIKFIGAKGGDNSRDIWCLSKCMPGKYIGLVTSQWAKSNFGEDKISFWTYGPEALSIKRIYSVERIKQCYDVLKKAFVDYVKKFFPLKKILIFFCSGFIKKQETMGSKGIRDYLL